MSRYIGSPRSARHRYRPRPGIASWSRRAEQEATPPNGGEGDRKSTAVMFLDVITSKSTPLAVALATILATCVITPRFNEQSLRNTQVNALSGIIPKLYRDTTEGIGVLLSMSAYGTTSVPILLAILETECNREPLFEGIDSIKMREILQRKSAVRTSLTLFSGDEQAVVAEHIRRKIDATIESLAAGDNRARIKLLTDLFHVITTIEPAAITERRSIQSYLVKSAQLHLEDGADPSLTWQLMGILSRTPKSLRGMNLRDLHLNSVQLIDMDFSFADLRGADFSHSTLWNCRFDHALVDSLRLNSIVMRTVSGTDTELVERIGSLAAANGTVLTDNEALLSLIEHHRGAVLPEALLREKLESLKLTWSLP